MPTDGKLFTGWTVGKISGSRSDALEQRLHALEIAAQAIESERQFINHVLTKRQPKPVVDELASEYALDYSTAKPNRFAE